MAANAERIAALSGDLGSAAMLLRLRAHGMK
jgi:hypothetical protein